MPTKNSEYGLDLLRPGAIISVIGGHSFLITPFQQTPIKDASLFIQAILYYFLRTIGVPLFLTLMEYFGVYHDTNRKDYSRILRVLIDHVFISLLAFTILYFIKKMYFLCIARLRSSWSGSFIKSSFYPYALVMGEK